MVLCELFSLKKRSYWPIRCINLIIYIEDANFLMYSLCNFVSRATQKT